MKEEPPEDPPHWKPKFYSGGWTDWRAAYGTESKEKTRPMKERRSRWDNLVVALRKYRWICADWMRTHRWSIIIFLVWAPIIWYLARAFR